MVRKGSSVRVRCWALRRTPERVLQAARCCLPQAADEAPAPHPFNGATVTSAALLGCISTVTTPPLLLACGNCDGCVQEPSGATAWPPSSTPESASGEGAVNARILEPWKPAPTCRCTATGRAS